MVQHRRGPWSQHEDSWLLSLVHRNGPHNWVRISNEIQTRSPKQCRERYHQNLKPTLNHDPITPEEGEQIERMVQEMGKRWAEIARRLKGRSDNAVKNWWNGGQNRRKRNPERPGDHMDSDFHDSQGQYPYATIHTQRHEELSSHHIPRPVYDATEGSQPYYAETQRPALPSINSPHSLKLPQPRFYEPGYSRPHPLDLNASYSRGPGYETPMPSPSGFSVVSADGAPSLITDTGSESRSPRGVGSPLDLTLAPLVGGRDERKNSCTRYLPATGFAIEDDDHTSIQPAYNDPYRRRASIQLPPPARTEAHASVHTFREPNYKSEPSLPLSHPQLPPLPAGQHLLPQYHGLAEPKLATSPGTVSPVSRQLPSPVVQTRSEPTSPKSEARDSRMAFQNILSN